MIKSKETYAIYRQLKYTTNRISDNFYKEHISLAIIYTRNKSIYQCLWFLNKTNSLSLWQYFLDAFFVLPANLWRHASAVQLINQRGSPNLPVSTPSTSLLRSASLPSPAKPFSNRIWRLSYLFWLIFTLYALFLLSLRPCLLLPPAFLLFIRPPPPPLPSPVFRSLRSVGH